MKKTVSILLVFAIMLAFAACGAKNETETTTEPTTAYQPVA